MNPELAQAIDEFLKALLYLAALVIVSYVIPYLRARASQQRYAEFRQKVADAVRYLEQMKKVFGLSNEELAARARLIAQQAAADLGLKIDVDEIVRIIEAAVNAVNAEQPRPVGPISDAGNG